MGMLVLAFLLVAAFAAGFAMARRPELPRAIVVMAWAVVGAVRSRMQRRAHPSSAVPRALLVASTEPRIEIVSSDQASDECPAEPEALVVLEAPAPIDVTVVPTSLDVLAEPEAPVLLTAGASTSVRFEPVAPRGTQSAAIELHAPEWRAAMAAVGDQLALADVVAVVFVHGTFTGTDPLSAYGLVERVLPSGIGAYVARTLRQKTRWTMERLLGDLGNFGPTYVRLFEEALRPRGDRIPCTDFVWSSENHHVGRLEGALGLVRVLATHAELGDRVHDASSRRILVIGHSHAAQLFALVTQLLARSIATEAILDIARARGLDVGALETDLARLQGSRWERPTIGVDFVTFGAPNRYAWASVPNVRALHVIAVPPGGAAGEGDWIRRLAVEGSDFPPLGSEDRRINAALAGALGHGGFAPGKVASALRGEVGLPANGEVAFVEYDQRGLLASGLGHGAYTRLDAMLFHARLVADRLYATPPMAGPTPFSARLWTALRGGGRTRTQRS
ncbi:MAG: hypothetical protein K0S65_6670 [Labilithrix sp.]|nr:hypothetical protein [Labilithrix sp.]